VPKLDDQLQTALGGTYHLERELGGGGMSRVFVADEQALGRKVVIKVLKPELVEGLSVERFKREVRLAARLQHPHIVPLLAAGGLADGLLYYAMPFVEGESLRAKLEREGALPVAEVLRFNRDLAGALAYAHRAGVVHRDVKPENILLSGGGAVITDFGIAKAIHALREESADGDPRRSSTLTAAGTSLGTPAYMAPEQAAGDAVDHRADLYSLGVVAYEMLAGRPPFDGRNARQLLAAHATEAAEPIERRRPTVPAGLAALVMQLLVKAPADRPQTADDVLRAIDTIASARSDAPVAATRSREGRDRGWRARLADPLVVALLVATIGAVAVAAFVLRDGRRQPSSAVLHARFTLELPADARLNPGIFGSSMAFSPDGSLLVYVGGAPVPRLYLRRLDDMSPRPLAGTEGAINPRFSTDGRWIAFVSGSVLRKVPVEGGAVIPIARGVTTFALGPDGTIVMSRPSTDGLWRVGTNGAIEQVTAADSVLGGIHALPEFLPDGNTVVFTSTSKTGGPILGAVRLRERSVVPLGLSGTNAVYLDGGYLAFARPDGSVSAVRFDAAQLRAISEPVPIFDGVAMKVLGSAELAVARNGMLVYLPGPLGKDVVEVDRHGVARVLIRSSLANAQPRVSPDGRRIAIAIGHPPYASDIWVYDIASATFTRLTTTGTNDRPEWTPDGRRVSWSSNAPGPQSGKPGAPQAGIWWQPWDARVPAEFIVPGYRGAKFSPRQDFLVAGTTTGPASEIHIVRIPVDKEHPSKLLIQAAGVFRQFRPSRDGRWLAYVSDETGTQEVYIQPIPGPGGRTQISNAGGFEPVWSPTGTELYYRSGLALISAAITFKDEVSVLRRDTLFTTNASFGVVEAAYDVMPDASHFIMLSPRPPFPLQMWCWVGRTRSAGR
jgi:Tol biopolymer transport system component/tRNA A-37 threonylcarbamoyl transferase component Bud32